MLNTLDRYIARQYLFNVVALMVLLFSFVVAVDVALNIDRFLDNANRLMAASGDASKAASGGVVRRFALAALLVVDLWWPRLLQLFTYMVGLVLVAAMGFTFTQLVRHREMVAVLAGGISLHRLARPVLLVAAGFMLLKVINQEFILSRPEIAPLLTRGNDDAGAREWSEFPVKLTADGRGRVWLARRFDPNTATLDGVTMWDRESSGHAKSLITAERAVWNAGAWELDKPTILTAALASAGSKSAGPRPIAPSRIETDLDPATLKLNRFAAFSQTLSWWQIGDMLATPSIKPEVRDKLQRIRWSRVSQVLSGLLALVITMPFFLMREPKNMLVQSLKCAPVGIVSLMGGILLSAVPWPGLPAGFAVFIPVLVLIPIAIAVVSWLKT